MAWDGHGIGIAPAARFNNTHVLADPVPDTRWTTFRRGRNDIVVVVVMVVMVEWVHDAIRGAFDAATEGVVLAVVVVVAHFAAAFVGEAWLGRGPGGGDVDVGVEVVGCCWGCATAVVALCYVELGFEGLVVARSTL